MPHFADLHTHSTASDGVCSPAELVQHAAGAGLAAVALTDHDSISGVAGAMLEASEAGIELVAGVEISAGDEPDLGRRGLHILGLFIDHEEIGIGAFLDEQARCRVEQKRKQIKRFQELGFRIDEEAVFSRVNGVPGKPHLVEALLELNPERELSEREIYRDYFGADGPAHVDREHEPPAEKCIEVIHRAGGVALLAHPLYQCGPADLEALVRGLMAEGLDGIEIDCPYEENEEFRHVAGGREEIVAPLVRIAKKLDLPICGGSDFHGNHIGGAIGSGGVERKRVKALRDFASRTASDR